MHCKKIRIENSEYTPSNPVEIQYSCGFSAYHLSKNRAYKCKERARDLLEF